MIRMKKNENENRITANNLDFILLQNCERAGRFQKNR